MGILKWYKRDPRAALIGMRGLTLEERGAYNTILDLIYCHDGALQDDSHEVCHELRCNARTWKRIKARLLELGKLYVHAGCLHNERADEEIVKAKRLVKLSAEAALKRWATHNEIKRVQRSETAKFGKTLGETFPQNRTAYNKNKQLADGLAMQPTSTKKESLSANIVPIPKRD